MRQGGDEAALDSRFRGNDGVGGNDPGGDSKAAAAPSLAARPHFR
jgi:hypothetical protein